MLVLPTYFPTAPQGTPKPASSLLTWSPPTHHAQPPRYPSFCWFVFFYFFDANGVWTQGFSLAKQAFYRLSHTSHFCSVILEMGSHKLFALPWLALNQGQFQHLN
jgi:hypothetical protein